MIMNIIISVAGLGTRFKNAGYNNPKPFVNVLGKYIIFYVLDNIIRDSNDKVFIIYSSSMDKWNFTQIINNRYKNIEFIRLLHQTNGMADALLYTLNNIKPKYLSNKTITLDCDCFYTTDILKIFRKQNKEENAVFCFIDKQESPIFSYVETDKNNKVLDIKEKIKISDIANTGCYCFSSGTILKTYCEKLLSKKNIKNEHYYYVSNIIKHMLEDGHYFKANIVDVKDYHCLGTPLQVKMYCNKHQYDAEKRIFCFDLDNTLVSFPETHGNYTTVTPIEKTINLCRYLKNLGHTIIIYTARRMRTHKGNIGNVIADIGKITIDTLNNFNIPYDSIYFGKPHAHFYIDDLAISPFSNIEKEIGFYMNKTGERAFNNIKKSSMDILTKTGPKDIIEGEIYWYNNTPQTIKYLFPLFINSIKSEQYVIEKISGVDIKNIYIHEALTENMLLKYLNELEVIHSSSNLTNCNITDKNMYLNYSNKIKNRFEKYDYSIYKNSNDNYEYLIKFFNSYEKNNKGKLSVIHGDPVFSNCIIEDNTRCFKFIDMRGKVGNILTIYGDKWYDYGKVYQSLIGYDEILEDTQLKKEYTEKLIKVFEKFVLDKYSSEVLNNIKMITNSLLFTLLPLHENKEKCLKYYNLIKL